MKLLWIVAALIAGTTAVQAAEKIGYGSREGMDLTIVSADGLDTANAVIHAVHERSDAEKFCKGYLGDKSKQCVAREVKSIPSFTYTANCDTGVFQAVGQKYRFIGKSKPSNDEMGLNPVFQLINLSTGEDLDGSSASGYPVAMDVFKHLCPAKAPGEIF